MKKIVFGSIILLLALTAAGCSSTTSAALPGTDWQVVTLGGTPSIAGADPTLSFATDGTVSGWDGCNRFGGNHGSGINVHQRFRGYSLLPDG
jgi:heat shock protein HslJ